MYGEDCDDRVTELVLAGHTHTQIYTHTKAVCHQSVSNGNTVTVDHFAAGSICPFALTEGTASKLEERWEGAGGGGS